MSAKKNSVEPKHYFLNERHQLFPREKDTGGRSSSVVGIDWAAHGAKLSSSFCSLRAAKSESRDPSTKNRFFVVAKPPESLERSSSASDAVGGTKLKQIDLAGSDSQMLKKLGFDLVAVDSNGNAIVHAPNAMVDQVINTLENLSLLGSRDHNKWAHLKDVSDVSTEYKTSLSWFEEPDGGIIETVIDLQPFLTRKESEDLVGLIKSQLSPGEKILRSGKEFSGRIWIGARLQKDSILRLASEFQSIFSIRPPLVAHTSAAKTSGITPEVTSSESSGINDSHRKLPCVAVMDTGIPDDHPILSPYIRGRYSNPLIPSGASDHHGSFVASRVIFGDVDASGSTPPTNNGGVCSVFDVNINSGPGRIYTEIIDSAIDSISNTNSDIRVFNLSFDIRDPLASYENGRRDSLLRQIADLDNRAFSHDLVFVVAAGNSEAGLVPNPAYPNHIDDEAWQLGAWSRCFNALTCGGSVQHINDDSVATEAGAPSPFTRIGPGFAKSRKPDLSAHAGNCDGTYRAVRGSGLGVGGCNESGLWEDDHGTSFAAPLLSRNIALLFSFLEEYCGKGSRPFSCLAKAIVALGAKRSNLSANLTPLADLTLGFGAFDFEDFSRPNAHLARFFWQGIIDNEDDLLTVELPLPGEWVKKASSPCLRLICAWETPVNHAVEHIWACRKVEVTLRPKIGAKAMRTSSKNPFGYPLVERRYDLSSESNKSVIDGDSCLAELKYSHVGMAEYPSGLLDFSSQQRVAIAYELFDEGGSTSPHGAIQALPVHNTLDRLSSKIPSSKQAVTIKVGNF